MGLGSDWESCGEESEIDRHWTNQDCYWKRVKNFHWATELGEHHGHMKESGRMIPAFGWVYSDQHFQSII